MLHLQEIWSLLPEVLPKGQEDGENKEGVMDNRITVERCPEWRKYPSYNKMSSATRKNIK